MTHDELLRDMLVEEMCMLEYNVARNSKREAFVEFQAVNPDSVVVAAGDTLDELFNNYHNYLKEKGYVR